MPHARIVSNHRLRIFMLIAAALVLPGMVNGEDIDLYTVNTPNSGRPNVLLVMDNAANSHSSTTIPTTCPTWIAGTAAKEFEQCALYNLVNGIGAPSSPLNGKINMGLMMFNPANGGLFFYPSSTPGALPLLDTTGATNFKNAIAGTAGGGTGPGTAAVTTNSNNLDESMEEAWAYYSCGTGLAGSCTGLSGLTYPQRAPDTTCQQNFVIYLANVSGSNAPKVPSNISNAQSYLATAMGVTASKSPWSPPQITLNPTGDQNNWGDEWTQFMYKADLSGIPASTTHTSQNIITYTIAVSDGCEATQTKCSDHINLIKSMAQHGGGKYFYVSLGDLTALTNALTTILTEVQATNSVFASVSLPVSVNAQGTSLNQVYVGMFRPDAGGAPRWAGNLKQYQLGFYTDSTGSQQVQLEDSQSPPQPAISSNKTGFITPGALSFWTADHLSTNQLTTLNITSQLRDGPLQVSSTGYTATPVTSWPSYNTPTAPALPSGFWVNLPSTAQGSGGTFDAPDGQIVDKGGVAEMTRADYLTSQVSRTIYTCNSVGGCPTGTIAATGQTALPTFDTNNTALTPTALALPSVATQTDANNLINWIRGAENNDASTTGAENPKGPGGSVTVRPSIHGDVLHSRPAVVNYGGSIGIVAFYGSNDGFFRAVNGNTGAASTTPNVIKVGSNYVRPGGELWSFIAPDSFGKFKHLYNNFPLLTLGAATGSGKDYFFDGNTTVYQDLRDAKNPITYIYVTARRGGRWIYAFDVSDPTVPKFLWSRNATVTGDDLAKILGQTWSQPKLALVKGNPNPVIVMGGGYNPAEDADPAPNPSVDGTNGLGGNAIVVLDAFSGKTVWTACNSGCMANNSNMTYAIPADITLMDSDGDSKTDRLYAADLGGNIWRADIDGATPLTDWKVTQIASLSTTGNGTGASCHSSPLGARKFFYPPDVTQTGNFDAVVVASGDREHPLLANASSCVVNRFYMLKDTSTGKSVPSTWTTITESILADETGAAAGTTPPYSSTSTTSGFYVTLQSSGEKAVNAPLTVAGYTYFGTNTPDASSSTFVCKANLGIAHAYAINFLTGAGLNSQGYITFDGGGLPPSPVFGLVAVDPGNPNVYTPVLIGGGNQTGAAVGGNNTSALGANKVTPPNTGKRKRTYWYNEGQK